MAPSGGEVVAGAGAGDDRLSALPDEVLVLILLRLDTVAGAARTAVLSHRWRRLWALLPELRFRFAPDSRHISEVLTAPEAPSLRRISVITKDDAADLVAAWLPLAAHRLSGHLLYHNVGPERFEEVEGESEEEEGAVPLPCFGNATTIYLDLGFLRLALPSSGAFARLAMLCLERIRFQGPLKLGDVVSSPRCPCLQVLCVRRSWGVDSLTVRSKSLLRMELRSLNGFQELTLDAPTLNELTLHNCFDKNQPIANIAAPQLFSLYWADAFDSSSVQLGNLGRLQQLTIGYVLVYGQHRTRRHNREIQWLLQRFQAIRFLSFILRYHCWDIGNLQYLMEDITHLPYVTVLTLCVMNGGHAFGASSFHMLRLCTGIRQLWLRLQQQKTVKEQSACPSGCFCDQPTNWKTEELLLNCLKKVKISFLKGCEHELVFVKQLFNWAAVLEKMTITFDDSISHSKAMELCQTISSFSRPETCLEFYMYHDAGDKPLYLPAPEDQGSGM